MGMAASQARFLSLTARKSNVEYQGQQVNQERTALANESANLYTQLNSLEVPTPPVVEDFKKTEYSFSSSLVTGEKTDFKLNEIKRGIDGDYVTLYSDEVYYNASLTNFGKNGATIRKADITNQESANNKNNYTPAGYMIQTPLGEFTVFKAKASEFASDVKYISDAANGGNSNFYNNYITGNTSDPVYEFKFGDNVITIPKNDATTKLVDKINNNENIKTDGGQIANLIQHELVDIYTGLSDEDKAFLGTLDGDPGLDIRDATMAQRNYTNESSDVTSRRGDVNNNDIYFYVNNGTRYYLDLTEMKKAMTAADGAENDGTSGYSANAIVNTGLYVVENHTQAQKEYKVTHYNENDLGRLTSISIETDRENGGKPIIETFELTVATVQDEDAFNQAMLDYEYQKAQYEKATSDINAKTEEIQAEDKTLELHLKQLDTEQNAIKTEMDAVQKVSDDNVESTFKTFG